MRIRPAVLLATLALAPLGNAAASGPTSIRSNSWWVRPPGELKAAAAARTEAREPRSSSCTSTRAAGWPVG